MGKKNNTKLALLILCLILTSIIVYWDPQPLPVEKKITLSQALHRVASWESISNNNLSKDIVASLDLDDYVNRNYSKEEATISLYIGYYLTLKKVGAAHSPLVCFPGQGWVVTNKKKERIRLKNNTLNVMTMIVEKGPQRDFLIYWFQSYKKTSPGTFKQKIYTLMAKYIDRREDNAFVRVIVPLEGKTKQMALATGIDFVESFYPGFLQFIIKSNNEVTINHRRTPTNAAFSIANQLQFSAGQRRPVEITPQLNASVFSCRLR